MSFLRPEALSTLRRWNDVLSGVVVGALGLWLATRSYGVRAQLGVVLLLVAAALIYSGIQRARRPIGEGGQGVVDIHERRLTYFGPTDGGTVSLDALSHIEVFCKGEGDCASDFYWVFHEPGSPPLQVPGNAEGAQTIFDALAALSDVDFEGIIAVSKSKRASQRRIWVKDRREDALT